MSNPMGFPARRADMTPEQLAEVRASDKKRNERSKIMRGRGWGAGYCKLCAGLPHRVEGERCRKCGLVYQAESR